MGNIHERKERKTLETILARINGRSVKRRKAPLVTVTETIPEPNRTTLNEFYKSLVAEELSLGRICTLMSHMYRISVWLSHKPFTELSKEDIIELVGKIRNTQVARNTNGNDKAQYSSQTIEGYKMTIKKFWRWLKNPGLMPEELKDKPYPQEVAWIKRKCWPV